MWQTRTLAAAACAVCSQPRLSQLRLPSCLQLGSELGLQPSHVPRLEATLDAFALLRGSKTDVLRDGDALLVNLSRKRGFAIALAGDGEPQHKRHKAEAEVQAVATLGAVSGSSDSSESSLEGSSSDDEESSEEESSDEESSDSDPNAKGQDLKTPAAVKLVDGNTTVRSCTAHTRAMSMARVASSIKLHWLIERVSV